MGWNVHSGITSKYNLGVNSFNHRIYSVLVSGGMMAPEKGKNEMWTSVSAETDADDCMRRWWFNKVVKLPQPQRKATVFGDVGHAVAERFLMANDRGLDVGGRPVNLYPVNWMTMKDRWSGEDTLYTITHEEAALIQILIREAIVQGILVREPGRIIEKDISCLIFKQGHAKIVMKGFVDLDNPNELADHKFLKDKKWALSPAKLKKSIQMMGYAFDKYDKGHQGTLWLTHNNFIKDFENPKVIKRSVEVTEFEVIEFYITKIQPLIREMLRYYLKYPQPFIHKWRDIPGANNPNQSCNYHYGHPCPYIGICSNTSSIDAYLAKYNLTVNQLVGQIETEKKGKPKMGKLMDMIKGNNKAAGTAPAPASAPTQPPAVAAVTSSVALLEAVVPPVVPAPAAMVPVTPPTAAPVAASTVPVAAPAAVKQRAPWYSEFNGEGCKACEDNPVQGYNSRMEPCQVCDARTSAAGQPNSKDYDVVATDGILTFTLKVAPASPAQTVTPAPQPAVQTQVVPQVADPSLPDVLAPAVLPPAASAVLPPVTGQNIKFQSFIQPPKADDVKQAGFTLLIGCTFASEATDDETIFADRIVKIVLEDIAIAAGMAVSAIEHFALMQAIDAAVPPLVASLEGRTVISLMPSKGSAHARVIDSLRLYAAEIIHPYAV